MEWSHNCEQLTDPYSEYWHRQFPDVVFAIKEVMFLFRSETCADLHLVELSTPQQ